MLHVKILKVYRVVFFVTIIGCSTSKNAKIISTHNAIVNSSAADRVKDSISTIIYNHIHTTKKNILQPVIY